MDAAERRKHPRITTYLPVRLKLQSSGRYVETLAKDVSLGGVRCIVTGTPEVTELLVLEVPLYKEVLPIQATAKVVWVQPIAETNQALIGIQFEGLTPEDAGVLAAYLEERLAQV